MFETDPQAQPKPESTSARGRQLVKPDGVVLPYQPLDDFTNELLRRDEQARQRAEDERIRKQTEKKQARQRAEDERVHKHAERAPFRRIASPSPSLTHGVAQHIHALKDARVATGNEVFSDATLLSLACTCWCLNGVATALSVQAFLGTSSLYGFSLGIILHIIISRFEMSYLSLWRLMSWYAIPIVLAVVVDAGSTSDGLRILASTLSAEQFGHMPNIIDQLRAILSGQDVSHWLHSALIFAVIGTFIALLIERVLCGLWRQFLLSFCSWREHMTFGEVKAEWAARAEQMKEIPA